MLIHGAPGARFLKLRKIFHKFVVRFSQVSEIRLPKIFLGKCSFSKVFLGNRHSGCQLFLAQSI